MTRSSTKLAASLLASVPLFAVPAAFAQPSSAQPSSAQSSSPQTSSERPVLLRDSFPIGDANGILCQVQDRSVENPAKRSMFDRSWAVVCRDSAQPVASIYSFAGSVADAVARIAPQRREEVDCTNGGRKGSGPWNSISSDVTVCTLSGTQLGWTVALVEQGGKTYVAEGFEAYDDATRLALQSVRDNRIARGTIDAASTSVADPLSFARVQAETLKPQQALAEGYRRNLGGEYAEASAYFETLQQRLASQDSQDDTINPGEFFINRALQKSNLGEFGEANRLFEQAAPLTAGDPVTGRLQRNFEAIHLLNQGFYPEAIERLDQQLDDGASGAAVVQGGLSITLPLSARINQANDRAGLLGFIDELKLTAQERSEILDAQALQLKGTALRVDGRVEEARGALIQAYGRAIAVRDGRVTSITRLRSQVLGELAIIAERQGQMGDAETYLRNGLAILEVQYPERRAVSGVQARLAGFLLRQGNQDEAVALYRGVIDRAVGQRDALSGFANQMNPYYRLLASQVDDSDQAAADFFKASQVLVRPGVAETQAILARELSANSTDGAQLFRQAINLGRDIERVRTRFQALGKAEQTATIRQERTELTAQIERFEAEQLIAQAKLAEFPEYRVVAPRSLELAEFRKSLVDGEAYARLAMVGDEVFMFYADRTTARAYQVDMSVEDLEFHVDMLRASISSLEGGRYVTYPYEIGFARELYKALFDPVASELAGVDHLIFEPDGALLRLPIDILVADDASVNAYQTRVAKSDADAFDFTGIAWLGRNRTVSTAVSAQAFVDARKVERSRATQEYLGMGKNTPIGDSPPAEIRAVVANGSDNCGWNAGLWNNPIDDAELITASGLIGESASQLITGSDFTDTAIKAKADLNDFRVLHFATHGLVTPPNPGCQAKPALLTSFDGGESPGLLTFEEIFALDLDADIVILSACDTAGAASIEATRAAGISSGGGTALDGLVRSFIGAGGRAVMASHWPAPDDFDATERLMSEMFRVGRTESIGGALRASQTLLMDDPATSHPYYWGGFAIIGDASRPLLSDRTDSPAAEQAATETVVGQ